MFKPLFSFGRQNVKPSKKRAARRRSSFRPFLEGLEDRQVPAVLTVTTTADSGAGSLRQAILDANNTTANPGQNTIHFNIAGSGAQTIALASPLPAIINPSGVIVDATTQPGFTSTPLVVLNGAGAGTGDGLLIAEGNSTVKGLAIENFASGAGIFLRSSGNTVTQNFLGTDGTGTAAAANLFGVLIAGANNTIGGSTSTARNVISGNANFGIDLVGSSSTGNLIEGNFIGTNAAGSAALANTFDGVAFISAAHNTIGGTATGAGNIISGNSRFGIFMFGTGSTANVLEGNSIGVNSTDTAALANADDGIALFGGASGNTIGGTTGSAANVLSGNGRFGLLLSDSGTSGNLVEGNFIGTNRAGTSALANTSDGIEILSGASGNTVGGTASGAGNVVAANGRFGLVLGTTGTSANLVTGNFIGTNSTNATGLGNAASGVALVNGASANTIGGTTSATANVISGNTQLGLLLSDAGTTGNVVEGNHIGVNQAGSAALANAVGGVGLFAGASTNTIGGTPSGAGNIISGNGLVGVLIGASGATGNLVEGNFIGTNSTGTTSLPNTYAGVMVATGASTNTIGGTVSGASNTIAFNGYAGVIIGNSVTDTSVGNAITDNAIYSNGNAGGIGIDLGNNGMTTNNGSGHAGPNHFQNFPVPTAATLSAGAVTLSFTLTSVSSSTFRLEFFLSNSADTTAQGRFFLGAATVTTDATGTLATVTGGSVSAGTGTITLTPPAGVTPAVGQHLTAVAILQTTSGTAGTVGDTSEFSAPLSLTSPATTSISPSTLPAATVNTAYSQTLTLTGGTAPVTFTVTSGTLPTGLTLSTTGVLSGTPTTTTGSPFSFTVMATDSATPTHNTATQNYTIVVNSGVTVTTTSLPNWTADTSGYSQTITATGGTAPYTFSATGSVPPGLSLSTGGVLSGTPTTTGTYAFSVTAMDTHGASGSEGYSVTINPLPAITTSGLASWTVNHPGYNQTISTIGGTGTVTLSAVNLPPGLSLTSTGILSGTPTATGPFTFMVTATDSVGGTGMQTYTVPINPAVTVSPTSLPAGVQNAAYNQTITASGGTGAKTFAVTAGTLPTGLSLSSGGVLSGTPTANGSFTFTVTATDTVGATGSHAYTVTIGAALTITPTSLPADTIDVPYSQTLMASGGTGTVTFATTAGTLPPGLTLSTGGVLSGTPTTAGSFGFTVTATDSMSTTGTQNYTVTINPAVTLSPTTLPSGPVNAAYNQTITASGGTGTKTFAATAGTLPTGLTLSTAGVLSGTPTAAGSFDFTVTATDSVGATGSHAYTVVISPVLTISPTSVPADTLNVAYNQTLTASGGTGTVTFATTAGALPLGVTLSTGGVLFGTPLTTGSFGFTVTATDSHSTTGSQAYTLVINAAPTISPATLPGQSPQKKILYFVDGNHGTDEMAAALAALSPPNTVTMATSPADFATKISSPGFDLGIFSAQENYGADYTTALSDLATFVQNGGTAIVDSWATFAGSDLTPFGGTPTGDSNGPAVNLTAINGGIANPLALSNPPSPYTAYSFGLTLDPTSGTFIAGVFSDPGNSSGTNGQAAIVLGNGGRSIVNGFLNDTGGAAGEQLYENEINGLLGVTGVDTVGAPYAQTFTASGGTGTKTFAVSAGTLPTGLTLSTAGVLFGTPTASGSYTFTVKATDAVGAAVSQAYTVLINPTMSINPASLPAHTDNVAYNQTLTVGGGTGSKTFALTSGTLPTGLTLSTSGVISGTPTASGSFSFTVTATDTVGATATRSYTI
jgi:hypothetical protein